MLLKHMILSHHGKLEYGSPKLPMLKEAEILCYIDNIDARMNMFDKAFKKTSKGQFTEKYSQWNIDNSIIQRILIKLYILNKQELELDSVPTPVLSLFQL